MAAVSASLSIASPITSTPSSSIKSGLAGASLHVLPPLVTKRTHRSLTVYAGGGKKIQTKEPFGPSGGAKFKDGLDASGRKSTGKGVYQFAKKYGANVDGYSPIYAPEEWSSSGDVYTGGTGGLTLWALTLGAILLGGALLVYNTSALAQ